jgi:SAM-dependent methyltransferase
MKTDKYITGNREAWNVASHYHQKAMGETWMEGFKKSGYTTFDAIDFAIYGKIPFEGKSVVQAPCNNGREILSFINMGAVKGVGFDVSDENIAFAEKLKAVSGIEAEFVRCNVYEIPESYNDHFDIGIISVGSVSWMPDLTGYFDVYRRLLSQNGILFIYEMHPVTMVFPYTFNKMQELRFEENYFTKKPIVTTDSLDYYGNEEYESPPQYIFQHTMADIIQALIRLGFKIEEFEEYPHDIGNGHAYLEGKVPLSFHLQAKRG